MTPKDREWMEAAGDKLDSSGSEHKLKLLAIKVPEENEIKIQLHSQLSVEFEGKVRTKYFFPSILLKPEDEFKKTFFIEYEKSTNQSSEKRKNELGLQCKISS